MPPKAILLADTILKQDEILSELLDNTIKQREALKGGRLSDLQTLMSELRHVSVRCQAIEAKRSRLAADIAADFSCKPIVSEIAGALKADNAEEAMLVEESAAKMMKTVNKLKMEMSILSSLMDEARTLNEMLISEWRKLCRKSIGATGMGTFDTKI
jgi:DNA repair exonuclease SbcCD ATPase subunit